MARRPPLRLRACAPAPGSPRGLLTLALGIGANTAIFTVVYGVLLKPLPFGDPDRLVYVHDTDPAVGGAWVVSEVPGASRRNRRLPSRGDGVGGLTITGRRAAAVGAAGVGRLLQRAGRRPLAGRGIAANGRCPERAPVIVLGYGLWQRVFGGSPAILGQDIVTDGGRGRLSGSCRRSSPPGSRRRLGAARDGARRTKRTSCGWWPDAAGRLGRTGARQSRAVTARFNLANGLLRGVRVWRCRPS